MPVLHGVAALPVPSPAPLPLCLGSLWDALGWTGLWAFVLAVSTGRRLRASCCTQQPPPPPAKQGRCRCVRSRRYGASGHTGTHPSPAAAAAAPPAAAAGYCRGDGVAEEDCCRKGLSALSECVLASTAADASARRGCVGAWVRESWSAAVRTCQHEVRKSEAAELHA